MGDHNHSYKQLFSHAEMVADLLRGFVREPWLERADLATLELVSGSYVTDDLRDREDDVVWRLRWGAEWLFVYLLLEFQSSVDVFMGIRVQVYLGLLYQDLIKRKLLTPDGLLPPAFAVVLYNGESRWTAPQQVADLIEAVPGGLESYRPQLRYLLLDIGRWREAELPQTRNLAAALFQLERSRTPADVAKILDALIEWLEVPEQASLRRAFATWLTRVLLPRRLPEVNFPQMTELREVRTMLAERVKEWTKTWREEGMQLGRQEGMQLGRQEGMQLGRQEGMQLGHSQGLLDGERLLLSRQIENKFGLLSDVHRRRLQDADAETLLLWGERLLTAASVEDVFN